MKQHALLDIATGETKSRYGGHVSGEVIATILELSVAIGLDLFLIAHYTVYVLSMSPEHLICPALVTMRCDLSSSWCGFLDPNNRLE